MKAFYIPAALLTLLFLGSLWIGSYVHQNTDQWSKELTSVISLMDHELWDEAQQSILDTREDWLRHSDAYHMIMEHQDLDEADKLFSGAIAACREKDKVELRIHLEQLITQLNFLAETQKISLKNIL